LVGLAAVISLSGPVRGAERRLVVSNGRAVHVWYAGRPWPRAPARGEAPAYLEGRGLGNILYADRAVGAGDFRVHVRLCIRRLGRSAASFVLGNSHFGFEGANGQTFLSGRLFGARLKNLGPSRRFVREGVWFDFEIVRSGGDIEFRIDGKPIYTMHGKPGPVGRVGLRPRRAVMWLREFQVEAAQMGELSTQPKGYSIPIIDLAFQGWRQVVVDREPGQYLGHPTTVLLEDGKTIVAVYPKGHGRGAVVLKRSTDGGLTWSERLPVPASWRTSKEVPTIYRVVAPDGVRRLIMFSGLYPVRAAWSEDDGLTWTELKPIGDFGGVVAMADMIRRKDGSYLAVFHDDGRFIGERLKKQVPTGWNVYGIVSRDGGLTWSDPRVLVRHPTAHLCEPGLVRSPDGRRIAMLLRENSRQYNSFVAFSDDEGETWTEPRELPGALTGDRHQAVYLPDGRLFVSFRDTTRESPTQGDWVGWVGTFDDIVHGREGQYRVRLMDNHHAWDCAYPALERLPDGTIVATTYGHWTPGEPPWIASVRFRAEELDAMAREPGPEEHPVFVNGEDGYAVYRIPSIVTTRSGVLLAFCEGRAAMSDHAQNDIVLKRSADGGRTWGPLQVVAEDGRNCLNDPCAVVLPDSGRVLLVYERFPEGFHSDKVVPGYDPSQPICRQFLVYSDDDGRTWSAPREITRMVKRPTEATDVGAGPGIGIVLRRGPHKGRILLPYRQGPFGKWRQYAAYSDDGGETWLRGELAPNPGGLYANEVQYVELADGAVLLNARSAENIGCRITAISRDGGCTWSPLRKVRDLVDSRCQASIVRYSDPLDGGKSRILFANPAHESSRINGTVRVSYDEGQTWATGRVVRFGFFAYSCLTVLPDGTIGLLYEADNYGRIMFARFTLEWLTYGRDVAD